MEELADVSVISIAQLAVNKLELDRKKGNNLDLDSSLLIVTVDSSPAITGLMISSGNKPAGVCLSESGRVQSAAWVQPSLRRCPPPVIKIVTATRDSACPVSTLHSGYNCDCDAG